MNTRKIYFFVIFLSLFYIINTQGDKERVINSCGDSLDIKRGKQPKNEDDCKDKNEHACKLVTIYEKDSDVVEKKYCAIIHGKYNDEEVWRKVGDIVGKKITIEGSGNFINISFLVIIGFLIEIFN